MTLGFIKCTYHLGFVLTSPAAAYNKSYTAIFVSIMSSAREFAESAIRDNKVVVFSKSTCPFCIKTKTTLTGLNIPFHAIELDVSGYITLNYSSLPISNSNYVVFLRYSKEPTAVTFRTHFWS